MIVLSSSCFHLPSRCTRVFDASAFGRAGPLLPPLPVPPPPVAPRMRPPTNRLITASPRFITMTNLRRTCRLFDETRPRFARKCLLHFCNEERDSESLGSGLRAHG